MSEYKIIQKTTPNQMSRFSWKPDIIVSHITEGSYTGAVSWLMNPASQASAHFVISKLGEITQLVDITQAAWINGTRLNKNDTGPGWYGDSTLKLVKERKTNANFYSVGIEHEGIYSQNKGKLTDAQFKATVWLQKHIISEVKRIYGTDIIIDREHIAGHYQVDPIRKPNCPGQSFQWDELILNLKGVDEIMEEIKRYKNIKEMPEWMQPYIKKWVDKGYIKGNSTGELDFSEDMVRVLIISERMMEGK